MQSKKLTIMLASSSAEPLPVRGDPLPGVHDNQKQFKHAFHHNKCK